MPAINMIMTKLTYFTSKSCQPCKQFTPRLETFLDSEYPDIDYQKLDIEDAFVECREHGIRSVPSIVLTINDNDPMVLSCGNTPTQWQKLTSALLASSD